MHWKHSYWRIWMDFIQIWSHFVFGFLIEIMDGSWLYDVKQIVSLNKLAKIARSDDNNSLFGYFWMCSFWNITKNINERAIFIGFAAINNGWNVKFDWNWRTMHFLWILWRRDTWKYSYLMQESYDLRFFFCAHSKYAEFEKISGWMTMVSDDCSLQCMITASKHGHDSASCSFVRNI